VCILGAQTVDGRSQNETDGFRAEVSLMLRYRVQTLLSTISTFHLRKHLNGKKFNDDDEVKEVVMTRFKGEVADFCELGIQKLAPRLNKFLDNHVNCVKKIKLCKGNSFTVSLL
jgi:hypothetical protein